MSRTTQLLAGEAILPFKFKTANPVRAAQAQLDACAAAQDILRAGESEVSGQGVTGAKPKKQKVDGEWCHRDDTVSVKVRDDAVARRLADTQAVVEGIAAEEVLKLSVAIQARIVSGAQTKPKPEPMRKEGFTKLVDKYSIEFTAFRKSAGLDPEVDVGGTADDNYFDRNLEVHGDDAYLRRRAKRLCKQRFVSLVKDEHPWPCALIEHFDLVEKSLFNLK